MRSASPCLPALAPQVLRKFAIAFKEAVDEEAFDLEKLEHALCQDLTFTVGPR